jgi:hypothetical protein
MDSPPGAIGAAGYLLCPNMTGTHLDHTLGLDARLDGPWAAFNKSL